ncbi:phosphohistidine phosphatase [Acetoanaerobium pronyense]|uniref:Phosphohistidine phosphatase n=1 Tax=Acetoanaerobium pronyense TaxID=1482736 RepID=A0ABS4KJA7_9FIRM|nr:histidine phosphatase family protein [Acetoanaerobium pronyense]MBP2027869.1 phosphohistidine phosphatase [Acetoanaerobium pronyense]
MKIILFRHGIAQERGLKENDDLRELTSKGSDKVEIAGKGLKKLIKEDKNISILTSPLLRAVQTAEILQNSIEKANISVVESISKNDFLSFENHALSQSNDVALIVVGHSPYLNEWCLNMTGVNLELKKGGAVCIEIAEKDKLQGKILWFIQPKTWSLIK